MLEIDGSHGEGGGQIVRTATALSALTGKEVRIGNIRANRSTPGLRPQHVKGIEALAELCDADLEGVEVRSQKVTFRPGEIKPKDLKIDIGTAGSVTLLLQSLMPPLMKCDEEVVIEIKGGTDVKWSPPVDYTRSVLLPLLQNHGYDASLEVKRRGFYPKGGGNVVFRFKGSDMKEFDLVEREEIQGIEGVSYASEHLRDADVADRQAGAARKALQEEFELTPEIKADYCDTRCPGSGLQIRLKTENSVIGGNALGEKGKPSEKVGKEAAEDLIRNSTGVVDRYAADQILPFMAVSGGMIRTSEVTEHCRTNVDIIEKLLNVSFGIDGNILKCRI